MKSKYTIRRQHRRQRLRKSRSQRRRRLMYGGNALDTYAASPLNPGWAIGGTNNFVGPTQIAMETKPVNMV